MRFIVHLLLALAIVASSALSATAAPLAPRDFRLDSGPPAETPTEPAPAPAPEPTPMPTQTTTSIQQYGITWTFSKPVQYGQFVNGDYWVVDPGGGINIVNISPGHKVVSGRTMNGSMVNPPANRQGYDSNRNYTSSLNIGIGISGSTPLLISGGDSLVSSISNDSPINGYLYLKTAAVLTCLPSPPPAGSFRPGYSDPAKSLYNANNLNYSLLAKLTPPASTPAFADIERRFQRVWLDHLTGWTTRALHPTDNMSDYGRELAADVGVGALMLHLNFTDAEKERLLISFVQLGIDLHGIVKAGGRNNWHPDGGHASGRKWPILFAGMMLNDAGMKNIGQVSGSYLYSGGYGPGNPPPNYVHFGEDSQPFYVTQADVDRTNSSSWNPSNNSSVPAAPYTRAMIGMPEFGIRHATHPTWDNANWGAAYRKGTAIAWSGFVLAARIMGAQSLWNHDALFDYQDRYMAITNGDPDPFGYIVPGEASGWRSWGSRFTVDMWDRYRNNY